MTDQTTVHELTNIEEEHSQTADFSPHAKRQKVETLVEFLRTRYKRSLGEVLAKQSVIDNVHHNFDTQATPTLIGRAVSKAFGKTTQSKGQQRVNFYSNLKEIPQQQKKQRSQLPSYARDTASFARKRLGSGSNQEKNTKLQKSIQTSPKKMSQKATSTEEAKEPTLKLPILKAKDCNIPMNLSVAEVKVIGALRKGQTPNLKEMSKQHGDLIDTAAIEHTEFLIKTEVQRYSQNKDSLLANNSSEAMESLSLRKCWEEYQVELPTLTSMIVAACTRKYHENLSQKKRQSITPGITTVISKCLGLYSERLSAWKTFYGLMLTNGGLTTNYINRVAYLGDSVTSRTINTKMNELAKSYDEQLKKWDAQLKQYGVVVDNVDIMTKPRRESYGKENTMHHMVQAIAVEERVKASSLHNIPEVPIDRITPKDIYPTAADDDVLKKMMVDRVLQVWSELPALKHIKFDVPSEDHAYTEMTRKKTNYVNLGVLKKNENIREELLFCLRQYHTLTSGTQEDLKHKLCTGDYLTFERGQQAINSQSDGLTPTERLEGLIMSMADFHVQLNFLKLIFRLLFQGDSQHSPGTLSHAKALLNARNVTSDPSARYYDCSALFEKMFQAYIRIVAMKELKLKSTDETPASQLSAETVRSAAIKVVEQYVNIQVPNLEEREKIRCSICQTKFSTQKNLRKHHLQKHSDVVMSTNDHSDPVFSYTCLVITLGLLRSLHNRAIQVGNGEHIIHLYKYMFIMFKANGSYKYGCGLLETMVQMKVLPKDMATRMMWNRFFNSYSLVDTNIPLDLALEHENRALKERLKTYKSTFTETHLSRISKARGVLSKIISHIDIDINYYAAAHKSKRELAEQDIALLIERYVDEPLLTPTSTGQRSHSPSLLDSHSNPLAGINGKSLKGWIEERLELMKVRHYYLQFSYQPASFNDDSSEEMYPHLVQNRSTEIPQ